MASQPKRIFTRVEAANTWTEVASFADTKAAFLRGGFFNLSDDPAKIEISIIHKDVIPDPVDLPALGLLLDALQISIDEGCVKNEGIALGAAVALILEKGDRVYLKSDQALTHINLCATLEDV